MFEHIIGNDHIKKYLLGTVNNEAVGNSLLFAGPEGIGKGLFAEAFAKLLICRRDPTGSHRHKIESGNHPDIRIYRPEGKTGMHSIATMRQFSEEVYRSPFEAEWKVFILHDADRMLPYSANALLKTFEEPAQDALIILLSSNPTALLPTVLSRCRKLFFQPLKEADVVSFLRQKLDKSDDEAQKIAAMAHGSIGQAIRLINTGDHPLRTLLLDFLAKGKAESYKELSGLATQISEGIESGKKQVEVEVRKDLLQVTGVDLSSVHKQSLEKEVEGAVMMHAMNEALVLLEVLHGWYRDLQLVGTQGSLSLLLHRDRADSIQQAFERGLSLPLASVQKAIAETRLSLERSTSVHICFENLFLKLGFI
ncbi:MAG: DNA polymerase III subunit [Parachlamydiaceae bacterium]